MSGYFIGSRDEDGIHHLTKVEDATREQLLAEVLRSKKSSDDYEEGFETAMQIVERVLSAASGNVIERS